MSLWIRNLLMAFVCISLAACGGSSSNSSPNQNTSVSAVSSSQSSLAQSSSSASSEVVGMASRPSNNTCLAPEPVSENTGAISWVRAFTNLPVISAPSSLFQLPGDNTHWYVLRQAGVVLRFDNVSSASQVTEALNIGDRVDSGSNEMGLLGAAPHPDFANNRFVFLYYTGRSSKNEIETRVARFKVGTDGVFDRASEFILLRFPRPFANHVGGQMAFDQQGYLYIASGDGGSGGDPLNMGQNLNALLGKILRIDVNKSDSEKNYAIPSDNPFINTPNTRPEIWAYGLRNPWRFSFDKVTNELWLGDVGQSAWEEINLITRGGNYGWGEMEGDSCYSGRSQCSTANKIKPLYAISQNTGACSVMGGYVYRGSAYPAAYGKYFYTDYCDHTMRSIAMGENSTINHDVYGALPVSIVSFAQNNQGELLAIGQGSAGQQIYKLEAAAVNTQAGSMADNLSDTGCVIKTKPTDAASGLIPYSVNSALWSDGAAKQRYLSLPNNTQITLAGNGDFNFPIGSVLMKHFKIGEKFVETRLFTHSKTGWRGFSYEWNDAQTDAKLLSSAKDKAVNNISWHFPSSGQCIECHTSAAGFSLGLETRQLNRNFVYPTSQISADQLATLSHIGLFSSPLNNEQKAAKLYALDDSQATDSQKARSYLHSNCANCHQPNGPTPVNMDLRVSTPLAQMNVCDMTPTAGDLGITNARILAAGDSQKSTLLKRMQVLDDSKMPPLAHTAVDIQAVQVISSWIAGLTSCSAE